MLFNPHILIVDDHREIRESVTRYLERNGMRASSARDAAEMDARLATGQFDLVVLDVMMPGETGLSACKRLAGSSEISVILLTALNEETDRIVGLELGADDYLSKPFNPRELVARVQATLRRMEWDRSDSKEDERLEFGPLVLSGEKRQAWVNEAILPLTPIEFSLLCCLARNSGQNMTRQQLLDKVWGQDFFGDERTVDAHIRSIRQKLRQAEETLRPIQSVWGVGYRFEG